MKLDGSIALVVGADSAVGSAIVRGLLAREAAKVYATSTVGGSEPLLRGAAHAVVDTAQAVAQPGVLARKLTDVTLLVNCMVAVQHCASMLAGADILPLDRSSHPLGRTLKLVDAFGPVLAANGGGAMVNVLSVLCTDNPQSNATSSVAGRVVDWSLTRDAQDRLSAQQTQMLYFRAQLAVGGDDRLIDDLPALAGHLATRVLVELESRCRHDGNNG